jgi:hypothetical protein
VGRAEEKRLRRRWEDNIKMGSQIGWGGRGLDCPGSGYGQEAGSCERGDEHSASMKGGEFLD